MEATVFSWMAGTRPAMTPGRKFQSERYRYKSHIYIPPHEKFCCSADVQTRRDASPAAKGQSIRVASLSLSMPVGGSCLPNANVTDSIEPVKGNSPFLA